MRPAKLPARFAMSAIVAAAMAFALVLPVAASADPLGTATSFATEGERTPTGIAAGSDGNLWYTGTNAGGGGIVRITPAGVQTTFTSGLQPFLTGIGSITQAIAPGADGNLWFVDGASAAGFGFAAIGRTTTSGVITEFGEGLAGGPHPGIAPGPGSEENLWFTSQAGNEKQHPTFSGSPTGGTFTLTLGAETTAPITYSTSIGTLRTNIKTALEALSGIGAGNVNVASTVGLADLQVEFKGSLASTDQPQMSCDGASLTPGGASCAVATWQNGGPVSIGKISTSGTITNYSAGLNAGSKPNQIAPGPDGNIWFTDTGTTKAIGKIPPSGTITEYSAGLNAGSSPGSITAGPDGNLWFTDQGTTRAIGKITPSGTITEYSAGLNAGSSPGSITAGPDGNLWFTDTGTTDAIGKITPSGTITEYSAGLSGEAKSIVAANGKLWFSEQGRVGRINTAGTITEFSSTFGEAGLGAITLGPDGNLWIADSSFPPKIWRFGITPAKAEFELAVTKEGTGSGTVVSNPAGIECGAICGHEYEEGTKVTLTASPSEGSLFVSWKGCETGGAIGRQCTVTMDKSKTVVAKFIQAYDVTVARKGSGLGKVSSSPGGVLCLSNCSQTTAAFKEATNVTLTATPSKHFTFTGWSGDCEGTGTCVLSALSADKSVEAEFTEVAKFDLAVFKAGGGQGTVKSNLAGINCGATCSVMASAYYEGDVVELTATPGKGSTFGGWSGGGCSGTGTCKVTMSEVQEVEAEFK